MTRYKRLVKKYGLCLRCISFPSVNKLHYRHKVQKHHFFFVNTNMTTVHNDNTIESLTKVPLFASFHSTANNSVIWNIYYRYIIGSYIGDEWGYQVTLSGQCYVFPFDRQRASKLENFVCVSWWNVCISY